MGPSPFVARPNQAIKAIQQAIAKTEQIAAAIQARARRSPRTKIWTIVSQTRWPQVSAALSSATYTSQLAFEF